jgi:hypothetical protein
MAGTLTIATLSDGTNSTSSTNCIQGSAKAWVSFQSVTSGSTVYKQYNVSSVTRNSQGVYTINFTNALPDANYAAVFGTVTYATNDTRNGFGMQGTYNTLPTNKTTTSLTVLYGSSSATAIYDVGYFCCAIFD